MQSKRHSYWKKGLFGEADEEAIDADPYSKLAAEAMGMNGR